MRYSTQKSNTKNIGSGRAVGESLIEKFIFVVFYLSLRISEGATQTNKNITLLI